MSDSNGKSSIAYCKIHPGIGIARLGNSPDKYFFQPELPDSIDDPADGHFKDEYGRMKHSSCPFSYICI